MDSTQEPRLPPGQYTPQAWQVLHYGPVPRFTPERWDFRIYGATATGKEHAYSWDDFGGLPRTTVTADFHCVTKFTITNVHWEGVAGTTLLELVPPDPEVTHVMAWAEYGYSANMRIGDFMAPDTLLATHRDGEPLASEHGRPVRLVVPSLYGWKSVKWLRAIEYLTVDRRGFWEDRGYHNIADPWSEQRYSYQEDPGDGPPLF